MDMSCCFGENSEGSDKRPNRSGEGHTTSGHPFVSWVRWSDSSDQWRRGRRTCPCWKHGIYCAISILGSPPISLSHSSSVIPSSGSTEDPVCGEQQHTGDVLWVSVWAWVPSSHKNPNTDLTGFHCSKSWSNNLGVCSISASNLNTLCISCR